MIDRKASYPSCAGIGNFPTGLSSASTRNESGRQKSNSWKAPASSSARRMTVRDLAAQIGLSSLSVTDRILKLKDAGAITGYTVQVDPNKFGLSIAAYVRMHAKPGEVKRVAHMLSDTPEVVEADRATGADCFLAKVLVCDVQELEAVVNRFVPFAATHTAIIQSSTVV